MPVYSPDALIRVLQLVRDKRADRAQTVALGRPTDWAEYRESVGYIEALGEVEQEILRVTGAEEDHFESRHSEEDA